MTTDKEYTRLITNILDKVKKNRKVTDSLNNLTTYLGPYTELTQYVQMYTQILYVSYI